MKCPSCGKELERMKRQVGTTESGDPIFNEYAVCRDCKKQWNLDRQRARKIAAKKEAEQAEAKPVDKAESKDAGRPAESGKAGGAAAGPLRSGLGAGHPLGPLPGIAVRLPPKAPPSRRDARRRTAAKAVPADHSR